MPAWRVAQAVVLSLAMAGTAAAQLVQDQDPRRCSRERPEDCLNGVGSGVTSLDSLRVSAERTTRLKRTDDEDETQARLGHGTTGMSAGDGFLGGFSVWASVSRSDYESDVAVAPYEGDTNSVLVGADRLFGDRVLVGLSLGYENTNTDTIFNGGEQDRDGYSVIGYAAVLLSDVFSVDFAAGYTRLETDQDRIDPADASTLRADFGADRAFVAANLSATYPIENWLLVGRAGWMYSAESQDDYIERGGPTARSVRTRHLDLAQAYVGGDVAYGFGAWEPYATVVYRNDFGRDDGSSAGGLPGNVGSTQPDDDDEFQVGGGLRYFSSGAITGSFEWLHTAGRKNFDDDTFSLTIRLDL